MEKPCPRRCQSRQKDPEWVLGSSSHFSPRPQSPPHSPPPHNTSKVGHPMPRYMFTPTHIRIYIRRQAQLHQKHAASSRSSSSTQNSLNCLDSKIYVVPVFQYFWKWNVSYLISFLPLLPSRKMWLSSQWKLINDYILVSEKHGSLENNVTYRNTHKSRMERDIKFAWIPRTKTQDFKGFLPCVGSSGQCEFTPLHLVGRKAKRVDFILRMKKDPQPEGL